MEVSFIESIPNVEEYIFLIQSTGWEGILEKGKTLLSYEFYEKHGFERRPDHSPGMRFITRS